MTPLVPTFPSSLLLLVYYFNLMLTCLIKVCWVSAGVGRENRFSQNVNLPKIAKTVKKCVEVALISLVNIPFYV